MSIASNQIKENMGVMGDSVTAMRDPIFYRWHKFVDSLFQQFKATLQPYTSADVRNENSIDSYTPRSAIHSFHNVSSSTTISLWKVSPYIKTKTIQRRKTSSAQVLGFKKQKFHFICIFDIETTKGWQESDVELSRGLDFSSPHPVQVWFSILIESFKIYIRFCNGYAD